MPYWTDSFSFSTGVVRQRNLFHLVATEDELAIKQIPHASIVTWRQSKWGQTNIDWAVVSICAVAHPQDQMIALGEEGTALVIGGGQKQEEIVRDGSTSPENRGYLRCIRSIKGKAYATGMDRQVYVREDHNKWRCFDESMRPHREEIYVGFNSIDGFSEKDIYTVGFKGEIWHFNGTSWKQLNSPTNIVLSSVCCAGDGNVYAVGRMGILLRGDSKRWEVIEHHETEEDFWGLAWYNDKLYISSLLRVLTLEKDMTLKMVDMDEPVTSAYHLSAHDGVLLSVGPKDVMLFDGKEWTRID